MKILSVIAITVLLAGLALEVAAYRINNDDDWAENGPRARSQQEIPYDRDGPAASDGTYERSAAGLAGTMVAKIAACQEIARRTERFGDALTVDQDVIRLSERDFVTFFDATTRRPNGGRLEYLYVDPGRDAVLAQYRFDRVEAVGRFKSNARDAGSGRFRVVMHDVSSNVSAGFDDGPPRLTAATTAAGPARFRYAEAVVTTDDGAETRAFDDALERRYLTVLEKAVSADAAASVDRGVIARIKSEIRKPIHGNAGQLFDMRWSEDDVSMAMPDVGFRHPKTNAAVAAEPAMRLSAASFYRMSENVYRMRYHFTLTGLEWTSPLTVESAGQRATVRSANVQVDEISVHVSVDGSYGHQQKERRPCGGQVNVSVEASGLRYNLNEAIPSELMGKVDNKLRRFIEHSLESHVLESLKQELCHSSTY